MDKSYVTMETHQCPVCGKIHEIGSLLIDTMLQECFDRYTCTGYSLCEEHKKQFDDGYVFLVEVSSETPRDNPPRTGVVMSIKKEVADQVFRIGSIETMAYINTEVTEKLKSMMPCDA